MPSHFAKRIYIDDPATSHYSIKDVTDLIRIGMRAVESGLNDIEDVQVAGDGGLVIVLGKKKRRKNDSIGSRTRTGRTRA